MTKLSRIADIWIARNATSEPAALAAIAGLQPAVVVTGGSAGIGLALARRFASQGCAVALVARGRPALDAAAAAIARDYAVTVVPIVLDVCRGDAAGIIDAALGEHMLYLDVLINNAGVGLSGAFIEAAPDAVDVLVALNMAAPTRLMRWALPGMLARGRGGILNVASLGGYGPGPYQAAYYASKAYLLSLTEAVAAEAAGRGVRVAVVAPGPVETGFHAAMGAEGARYRQLVPSLTAEAVARAAVRGYALGRRVIVPGLVAKALMLGVRAVPHPVLSPFIGWLLKPPPR